MGDDVERVVLPDGSIRITAGAYTNVTKRVRPGHLLFANFGVEVASVRNLVIREFEQEIAASGATNFYGDMRGMSRIDAAGRDAWGAFGKKHKSAIRRAVLLVDSKLIEMAISMIALFSGGGLLLRSVSNERAFVDDIAREVPGFKALPETMRLVRKTG